MRHFFLFFSTALLLCSSIVPSVAHAQTELQFDQRCFTEDQCTEIRKEQGLDGSGLVENSLSERSCNGFSLMNPSSTVGFCTAGREINTEVTFGGRSQFDDVADFITFIFQFSFGIAIVLAVIMILAAGIQWMSSAGNSSVIGEAQKRIGGAILGLFLLSMSYIILDTINPALVSLRPLDVYLINPIETAPEFCTDLSNASSTPLYLAARNGTASLTPLETAVGSTNSTAIDDASCGDQFYIANAGGQTCRGQVCPNSDETCVPFTIVAGAVTEGNYDCFDGRYMVSLKSSAFSQSLLQNWNVGSFTTLFTNQRKLNADWISATNIHAIPVCKNPNRDELYLAKSNSQPSGGGQGNIGQGYYAEEVRLTNVQVYTIDNEPLRDYYIHLPDNMASQTNGLCGAGTTIGLIIELEIGVGWRLDKQIYLGTNGHLVTDPDDLIDNDLFIKSTEYGYRSNFFYQYTLKDNHIVDMKNTTCLTNNPWDPDTQRNLPYLTSSCF